MLGSATRRQGNLKNCHCGKLLPTQGLKGKRGELVHQGTWGALRSAWWDLGPHRRARERCYLVGDAACCRGGWGGVGLGEVTGFLFLFLLLGAGSKGPQKHGWQGVATCAIPSRLGKRWGIVLRTDKQMIGKHPHKKMKEEWSWWIPMSEIKGKKGIVWGFRYCQHTESGLRE